MRRVTTIALAVALAVTAAACEDDFTTPPVDPTQSPEAGENGAGAGQDAGQDGAEGPLLLIMDASNSMNEDGEDGQPLIDSAKQALHEVVAALPDEQEVGLRVYGHRIAHTTLGCDDTELVHPVSTLDRPALDGAIDDVEAVGMTPIGLSLEEGAKDLPADGPRTIILVSDGLDSCAPPDPCQVAFDLTSDTGEFIIHTVGFALGNSDEADEARDQLTCIASAGGGQYQDAANAAELADAIQRSASEGK